MLINLRPYTMCLPCHVHGMPCLPGPWVYLSQAMTVLLRTARTGPANGIYTPPMREVMAEVIGCQTVAGAANNMTSGDGPPQHAGCQYRNPTIEYIWPENAPGAPIVENNFQGAHPVSNCMYLNHSCTD